MYFFVGIQLIDTSSGWLDIKSHLSMHSSKWTSNLNNSFWDKASGQYKKMVYTKPGLPENWENLAYFASQNSMFTNIAYLTRYDLEKQNSFYKTLEVNLPSLSLNCFCIISRISNGTFIFCGDVPLYIDLSR